MNLKIKRILVSILIVINCIIVFCFSAQDSKKSSATSRVVVDKIVDTISTVNKKVKKNTLKEELTFYVRKCAHFSIYTSLGIWLMVYANTYEISFKRKIAICIVFGMLYAISDEFHQSFVCGRSCELRDVCIDTSGVLFGGLLVSIILKMKKQKKHKIFFKLMRKF